MVYRCYSMKKAGFDIEAEGVYSELKGYLGVKGLTGVKILNRYDVEGIDRETFEKAAGTVFSEPQCDEFFAETLPELRDENGMPASWILPVEALPGQYDQRADSCAQCIQVLTCREKPAVIYAKLYVFFGLISDREKASISEYLINPLDSRMASMDKPETLEQVYPEPEPVACVDGFLEMDREGLLALIDRYSLAMDIDDILFMQDYFREHEKRQPTETELRVVDTYWSDHCRHTTFGTHLYDIEIDDPRLKDAFEAYLKARDEVYGEEAGRRPVTLMDVATIGAKLLKKRGLLDRLDQSEEVNACSIRVSAKINGVTEEWLVMFKNETHNHPTEIEPFGGAATCIGGAIRDPLSGRAYVYQAMRVTGSGDPRTPIEDTLPGKLPQRKITTTAAAGYSSYGNQIGLATGLVHEIYHPGYVAKRMEVGAVVGAAPASSVVRQAPEPGDVIILLGGRTGRDGCGGATGSSKTHNMASLNECAAEVQKGNPPEERKMQRLFRRPEAARLIKRCNDFGAGGVSVAIGELADGVFIMLDKIKKKYEGLSGTELAISESQERMAVVVAPENAARFIEMAAEENLEATIVAYVTEEKRMVMEHWGRHIVSLSREFLSSNGAVKRAGVRISAQAERYSPAGGGINAAEYLLGILGDLNFCSQRGLGERFDGSIGAGSVLMPYGGKTQRTPAQVMAALLPAADGGSETCTVMSFAFDPYHSEKDPFAAAKNAVITSVAKLVAAGCDYKEAYLSFQEYFEKLGKDPARWGKPLSALLGALDAQLGLEVAAIGGKDSMSGSFLDMDVPPTLISFAIAAADAEKVISPEFKEPGSHVYLFSCDGGYEGIRENWTRIKKLADAGIVRSAWAVCEGGVVGGIFKMAVGNNIGFRSEDDSRLIEAPAGSIICECTRRVERAVFLGYTTQDKYLSLCGQRLDIDELARKWESTLEDIFPRKHHDSSPVPKLAYEKKTVGTPAVLTVQPGAVIPVFPGTNCEYDTAAAIKRAGGKAEIIVIRNISSRDLEDSVEALAAAIERSQMIVLPGGFSSGDEPEGSGKFIAAFFRNPKLTDRVHELLYKRDGIMLGICNGFQALIKLGLVPFGEIRDMDESCPTLTFNHIGRHQSRYVTTSVVSANSPWLLMCEPGDVHTVAISHGEGRFTAPRDVMERLIKNGQIATQYTDPQGCPSMDIEINPNGSLYAVEGILSPDGRVFGKMCHTERSGKYVAKNIYGDKWQPVFESGIAYFKL